MTTPWESCFAMQMAVWQGWLRLMMEGAEAHRRLCEHQLRLWDGAPFHRWHDAVPCGADWFDHYGSRAHDVNVERV